MSDVLASDEPVVVDTQSLRIGTGPWARLLATAIAHDESSRTAQHGDELARSGAVSGFAVAPGTFSARVVHGGDDCRVTLTAEPVPPRIWFAMTRAARGRGPLEAAVKGRSQSVHLEHLLTEDWDEPLVPRSVDIGRACTCSPDRYCEHIVALAYVAADAIDRDPAVLLRWRGCVPGAELGDDLDEARLPSARSAAEGDPWLGGELPALRAPRPLPVGSVLKRLGPSGIGVGQADLADVLNRAYVAFAERGTGER